MQYRSLNRTVEPAVEPVSLAEAKAHLRVDIDTDDAYVSALLVAAREYCETYLDETMLHTQYVMKLDMFPVEIELPRPPMAQGGTFTAVTITYTLDNGSTALQRIHRVVEMLRWWCCDDDDVCATRKLRILHRLCVQLVGPLDTFLLAS